MTRAPVLEGAVYFAPSPPLQPSWRAPATALTPAQWLLEVARSARAGRLHVAAHLDRALSPAETAALARQAEALAHEHNCAVARWVVQLVRTHTFVSLQLRGRRERSARCVLL